MYSREVSENGKQPISLWRTKILLPIPFEKDPLQGRRLIGLSGKNNQEGTSVCLRGVENAT